MSSSVRITISTEYGTGDAADRQIVTIVPLRVRYGMGSAKYGGEDRAGGQDVIMDRLLQTIVFG